MARIAAREDAVTMDVGIRPDARAPREARRSLRALEERVDTAVYENLRLLVSELVSNSVRHAELSPRDEIRVRVERQPGLVRASVTDPGRGFQPDGGAPEPESESGWGMFLLDAVADRWGIEDAAATRVWFELAHR